MSCKFIIITGLADGRAQACSKARYIKFIFLVNLLYFSGSAYSFYSKLKKSFGPPAGCAVGTPGPEHVAHYRCRTVGRKLKICSVNI